jgi:hypothetical protein
MATAEQREQALEDARSKIDTLSKVDSGILAREPLIYTPPIRHHR